MLEYFYKAFLKIKPHPRKIHVNRFKDKTQNSQHHYPGESILIEQVKMPKVKLRNKFEHYNLNS